jgi:hypothetical protein
MARLLRRRGNRRKREWSTWVAKADVEGHVDATIPGGEVEACLWLLFFSSFSIFFLYFSSSSSLRITKT